MTRLVEVAEEVALRVGVPTRVEVEGREICLVRCDAGVYAVDDVCSHEDFSLSEGDVDTQNCEIECGKHGSLFSLLTGAPLTLPATMPIATFPVSITGGLVYVELP